MFENGSMAFTNTRVINLANLIDMEGCTYEPNSSEETLGVRYRLSGYDKIYSTACPYWVALYCWMVTGHDQIAIPSQGIFKVVEITTTSTYLVKITRTQDN